MAKIDAQAQIAKHGENLREFLKELKQANNDKRKEHVHGKIKKETFELANLLSAGIQQGAIVGDPTGVIMGTTVFGSEVDVYARQWFESIKEQKTSDGRNVGQLLRQALHAATNAGADTGPWKRVTLFFKDGSRIILEKGRHVIQLIYKGITFVAKWIWARITGLWNWTCKTASSIKNRIMSFFKSNKDVKDTGTVVALESQPETAAAVAAPDPMVLNPA